MGWPPGHERFVPAKIFRRSPMPRVVTGLSELATTAMSLACAAPWGMRESIARPRRSKVVIGFTPMLSPISESKCELQLQAIQVGLAAADCVVQLCREGNVAIQVVTGAERRTVTQADVVEYRVGIGIRVHILIAEKRSHPPNQLGEL